MGNRHEWRGREKGTNTRYDKVGERKRRFKSLEEWEGENEREWETGELINTGEWGAY